MKAATAGCGVQMQAFVCCSFCVLLILCVDLCCKQMVLSACLALCHGMWM